MKWTKTFPTQDGVYWTRLNGDDADHVPVRVENGALFEFGVDGAFGEGEYVECEFLGPVTPNEREQVWAECVAAIRSVGSCSTKDLILAAVADAMKPKDAEGRIDVSN